eukprot:jgi/Botrbrau1/5144/Bobra.0172s0016.1
MVYAGLWGGRRVAVKFLSQRQGSCHQHATHLEVDMLQRLRHPGLLHTIGLCAWRGPQVVSIMEICPGGDLKSALEDWPSNSPPKLPWRGNNGEAGKAVTIALDIARALAYLHDHQVAHLDLKPANVLLQEDQAHAKLAELGMSKWTGGMTVSRTRRGGVTYMAPELLTYQHTASTPADIYSFGIILHQLVTGQVSKRRQILRPLRSPEECSSDVAALCRDCLQIEPKDRPLAAHVVGVLEQELASFETAALNRAGSAR